MGMTTKQILQGIHDWALQKVQNVVYDISAAHPDGQGNPTPYADLTAALGTGGVNIPEDIRKGGMSIKFIQGTVQSYDNKYVQYRLMSDTFNTTVANWQGVDDEPTTGSDNLVKSGGISGYVKAKEGYIDISSSLNEGEWIDPSSLVITQEQGWASCILPVNGGDSIIITGHGGQAPLLYATLNSVKKIVKASEINAVANDLKIDIKESECYILFNFSTNYNYELYKKTNNSNLPIEQNIEVCEQSLAKCFVENNWISNYTAVGYPPSLTVVQSDDWDYCTIECSAGERFVLSCTGGASPRAYAILDSNKYVIYCTQSGKTISDEYIIIPENGKYLVINALRSSGYSLKKIIVKSVNFRKDILNEQNILPFVYLKRGIYDDNTGTIDESPRYSICSEKIVVSNGSYHFSIPSWLNVKVLVSFWEDGVYKGRIHTAEETDFYLNIDNGEIAISIVTNDNSDITWETVNGYSCKITQSDYILAIKNKQDVFNEPNVLLLEQFGHGIYDSVNGRVTSINYCLYSNKLTLTKGSYRITAPSWLGLRTIISYWVNGEYQGRLYDNARELSTDIVVNIPADGQIGINLLRVSEVAINNAEIQEYSCRYSSVIATKDEKGIASLSVTQQVNGTNDFSPNILKRYINGTLFGEELDTPIVSIDGVGGTNKLHHTPCFCIKNNVVYFALLGADIPVEIDTHESMRIIFGYFDLSTPNDITYLDAPIFKNGETYNGVAITRLDACAMVYFPSENGCHIYTNVGNSSVNFIIHRYYDFQTNQLSEVTVPTFVKDSSTISFTKQNINALGFELGTNPQLQMLCPNSYDGYSYGSYSGGGGDTIIVRTNNGTSFEYLSKISFEHNAYYETTVANISENVLATMTRQRWSDMCQKVSFYHMDTDTWDAPIDIADSQSRTCAFKFGDNWYFLHNFIHNSQEWGRHSHQLLVINGNVTSDNACCEAVKDTMTSVPKFYYYIFPYEGVCYIMYVNNRQSINFCSITIPDTYSHTQIKNAIMSLF